jgi:Protein of unknown function (DUF3631)
MMGSNNILDEIYNYVGRFMSFPDNESRVAHTLWIAHTHLMDAFYTTPRLYVLSAEKRCGKTRLLELTALLVKNAETIYDPTPAALYTAIELEKPTLLVDEIDRVYGGKKDTNALTGIIDAGFQRGGTVPRVEMQPQRHIVRFRVFAPMLLAGIDKSSNPDTIEDRAITIRLNRKLRGESVEKFRPRKHEEAGRGIGKRLSDWAASEQVKELTEKLNDPEFPDGIDDRDADKWEALFIVADVADAADAAGSSRWGRLARQAAEKFVREQIAFETTSPSELLLIHIKKIFEEASVDRIQTSKLLDRLEKTEEAPWSTYEYGKPLTSGALARLLKPHGITSIQYRFDGVNNTRGYARASFKDAWDRYTPSEMAGTSATDDTDATSRGMSAAQHAPTPPKRRPKDWTLSDDAWEKSCGRAAYEVF